MRRVIGIDIHRTFGEVVIWEEGGLRYERRIDMTRTALQRFGKSRPATDAVVIEASGNGMAVSRVLSHCVKRVVIAKPLQVKAIAHAHVKTDKVDAGTLASVYAAGYWPEIRPDAPPSAGAGSSRALPDRSAPHPDQERRTCDPSG